MHSCVHNVFKSVHNVVCNKYHDICADGGYFVLGYSEYRSKGEHTETINILGRYLSRLPEITNEVVLYELCTPCTVLPSYESAKLTAISRVFMSHWFSSTPLAMSIRTPFCCLIPWPSVRGRIKINVTVKFLKWQRDLSVWPNHSLVT